MTSSFSQPPSVIDQPIATTIETWLCEQLATSLNVAMETIDPDVPFDSYGLDSTEVIGLSGDLEEWLQQQVSPMLFYDYPTVATLAEHLADRSLPQDS